MSTFEYDIDINVANSTILDIGTAGWWTILSSPGKPVSAGQVASTFTLNVPNGSIVFTGSFDFRDPTGTSPEFDEGTGGAVSGIEFFTGANGSGARIMNWSGSGIDFLTIENIYNFSAITSTPLDTQGIDAVIFGVTQEIVGSNGDDTAFGENGDPHTLYRMRDGDDNVILTSAAETIFGGLGNDSISALGGADHLMGEDGLDVLRGGSGDDTLDGGADQDTLEGGLGTDVLMGGADDDVYVFAAGDGRDRIVESSGRDTLVLGASLIVDDLILAVAGSDIHAGFYNRPGDVIEMINAVTTQTARTDILSFSSGKTIDLGGIVGGNNYDDTVNLVTADDQSTFVNTRGGNDVIDMRGGNDIVVAGSGDDTITGGLGIDHLFGGMGDDFYLYSRGDGTDRIEDSGGTDTLQFVDPQIVRDDLILAVRGADILLGFYNQPTDVVELISAVTSPAERVDKLRFSDGTEIDLAGIVGGDNFDDTDNVIVGPSSSTYVNGRGGNDSISGNAGNDILLGGSGDDTIDGGLGLDVLYGGSGSDQFRFSSPPGAGDADRIEDFLPGTDVIALSSAVFGLPVGALPAGSLINGTTAADSGDRLIFDSSTVQLFFDPDGTGAAVAQKIAELPGITSLAESDFLVF